MATTDPTQRRKTGDALILSGTLAGSVGLLDDDADWVGATGEIHIVTKATKTVPSVEERSEPCTITAPVGATPGRYSYIGAPIDEGDYEYEIQVTFVGLADPLTFPNNAKEKFKLDVGPELA